MSWRRRFAAAAALTMFLIVGGASSASAIDIPGVGDVLDKACETKPPTPEIPGGALENSANYAGVGDASGAAAYVPMDPNIPDDQEGLYTRYRMAGLRWTTAEQSCFDTSRFDTMLGTTLNQGVLNVADEAVNELQIYAQDPNVDMPYDGILVAAVTNVGEAFWSPIWIATGAAVAGLVLLVVAAFGNTSAALSGIITMIVVLGSVTWVTQNPTAIPDVSDKLTAEVSTMTSGAMMRATGGPEGIPPGQALAETYYRATAYQAWLVGSFCGDKVAEDAFGPRFLEAQAWNVAEWEAVRNDPAAQAKGTLNKQVRWTIASAELKKDHPSAYACWSGETNGRLRAAAVHAGVTGTAGPITAIANGAVMVLRNTLRLGIILVVAFGVVMMVMRRATQGFVEILALGLLGPPFVSVLAGTMLFGFQAVMANPAISWFEGIMGAVFLALAIVVLRKPLSRILAGVGEMGTAQRYGRAARRRMRGGHGLKMYTPSRTSSRGGGGVVDEDDTGTTGGGAAVVASTATHHQQGHGESRRATTPRPYDDDDWEPSASPAPAPYDWAQDTAPMVRTVRRAGPGPAGARPFDWAAAGTDWDRDGGSPMVTIRGGDSSRRETPRPAETPGLAGVLPPGLAAEVSSTFAHYRSKATAAGKGPTDSPRPAKPSAGP